MSDVITYFVVEPDLVNSRRSLTDLGHAAKCAARLIEEEKKVAINTSEGLNSQSYRALDEAIKRELVEPRPTVPCD